MLNEKRVIPDARLECLIEMIGKCDTIADVGCDHGRLGISLLQLGQIKHAIMTDISAPSLEKARRLTALTGLEDKVTFGVGSGLSALNDPADVIVIAGMGGETISSIMEACPERYRSARFLLQPNVAIPQLRKALATNGFMITDERVVREGRRLYVVIEAIGGEMRLNEKEIEVGPCLLKKGGAELTEYADFKLKVLKKALEGAKLGNDASAGEELERAIAIWEGTRQCL